eukprot:scaffold3418_cov124-Isochrysis_galbana.AAC.40
MAMAIDAPPAQTPARATRPSMFARSHASDWIDRNKEMVGQPSECATIHARRPADRLTLAPIVRRAVQVGARREAAGDKGLDESVEVACQAGQRAEAWVEVGHAADATPVNIRVDLHTGRVRIGA